MNKARLIIMSFTGIWALLQSCSTTRTLGDNEQLYKKARIEVKSAPFIQEFSIKNELEQFIIQESNNKLLGFIPFRLYMYNLAGENTGEKGFRHWLKTKIGEPPVIYNDQATLRSLERMKNYLYSIGYFHAKGDTVIVTKNQKTKVTYRLNPQKPFKVKKVIYPQPDSPLKKRIRETSENSFITPGKKYNLNLLKQERKRIDQELKNIGYFFFRAEYILFKVDSNETKRTVDLHITLKKNTPAVARKVYKINKIAVYPGYSLQKEPIKTDTTTYEDIDIIGESDYIRHKILLRSIFFEPGDLYSEKTYQTTINKLTGLKIFKFVNLKFNDTIINNEARLNIDILLTKAMPRSLRLEAQIQTKSNNFTGPGLKAVYTDRNLFNGGENLDIQLNAGFETQLADNTQGLNSYEFGANSKLALPVIVFPFIDMNRFLAPRYTPHTNFKGGFNILDRVGYFTLHNANFSFGYDWKETDEKYHNLTPLSVTYTNLFNSSAAFEEILQTNQFIRESFKEQLITSLKYDYTFNDQMKEGQDINQYFNINIELAGNLARLTENVFSNNSNSGKVLGIGYSQYVRSYIDTRFYFNINKNSRLVYRWYSGVGYPYGNSNTLPYTRQFYVGGATSLRGFQFRSVGPGAFKPPKDRNYFDQTGDIKIENNLEYRFSIAGIFKGALFTDAGNVWLTGKKEAEVKQFKANRFVSQLAVSIGTGLRIAPQFFVLRLDVGIPVRKPYFPSSERWVFNKIDFGKALWRRNNIVVNIAIGYPF